MAKGKNKTDWEALLSLCKDKAERMVVEMAREGGDLNEAGRRAFRRVEARTEDMRKKLRDYSRAHAVRKRRVDKNEWPKDAPTASEAVDLGLLDKSKSYDTDAYVEAVSKWLEEQEQDTRPVQTERVTVNGNLRIVILGDDSEEPEDEGPEDKEPEVDVLAELLAIQSGLKVTQAKVASLIELYMRD